MSELNSRSIEQSKLTEHFCSTKSKLVVTSMEWTILNFNLLKFDSEVCLKSSSFESTKDGISTGTWYMKLVTVPMYANEGRISLFLVHPGYRRSVYVGVDVWIVDADGKVTNKKKICYELDSSEFGFHHFIKKSSILDSHLPNGNLTVHCFLAVVPLDFPEYSAGKPKADDLSRRGYLSLLKEGVFSDAVLVCGDKRFQVHKCVLSARSLVFRAIFQKNVEGDVKIEDIDEDILENLLSYIYSGNIQGKCTANMAIKLLNGAKKYCLLELKEMCENFLKTNVAVLNLFEVASIAELYNMNSLKEVCVNFLYGHGKEIFSSWNFKEFFNPAFIYLLTGVLKQMFKVSESSQSNQYSTSRSSLTSQSEQFGTSRSSRTSRFEQFAMSRPGLTSESEEFGTSRQSRTEHSEQISTSRPSRTSQPEQFAISRPGLTSESDEFATSRQSRTSQSERFSRFRPSRTEQSEQFAKYSPSLISQSGQFATSRPSLTLQSEQFSTSSSGGLRDAKLQAKVKGIQSSALQPSVTFTAPNLSQAMQQAVVKGNECSPKQTTFLFGLSSDNHPVFPPKKNGQK